MIHDEASPQLALARGWDNVALGIALHPGWPSSRLGWSSMAPDLQSFCSQTQTQTQSKHDWLPECQIIADAPVLGAALGQRTWPRPHHSLMLVWSSAAVEVRSQEQGTASRASQALTQAQAHMPGGFWPGRILAWVVIVDVM